MIGSVDCRFWVATLTLKFTVCLYILNKEQTFPQNTFWRQDAGVTDFVCLGDRSMIIKYRNTHSNHSYTRPYDLYILYCYRLTAILQSVNNAANCCIKLKKKHSSQVIYEHVTSAGLSYYHKSLAVVQTLH